MPLIWKVILSYTFVPDQAAWKIPEPRPHSFVPDMFYQNYQSQASTPLPTYRISANRVAKPINVQ